MHRNKHYCKGESKMQAFFGIDVGTTNIKACLFAAEKGILACAMRQTPVAYDPLIGESHHPALLWETVIIVMKDCLSQARQKHGNAVQVLSISVASMGEEVILLDKYYQPVGNTLIWYDSRPLEMIPVISERIGAFELRQLTGLSMDPSYTLLKLLWLRKQNQELFEKAKYLMPVSDYINFCLTGRLSINPSLASRTMLYSPFTNHWLIDLISEFELTDLSFPEIIAGGNLIGNLTKESALALGLSIDTKVGIGGHDSACASLAAGIIRPGSGIISSGTAEGIFVPVDNFQIPNDYPTISVGRHCVADQLYISDILPTGAIIRWAVQLLNTSNDSRSLFRSLIKNSINRMQHRIPSCGFSYETDYISLKSFSYTNLTLTTELEDMINASLIFLTDKLVNAIEAMEHAAHQPIEQLIICGGLSEIPEFVTWRQQYFKQTLLPHHYTELTAAGAAILGAVASHAFGSYEEAINHLVIND